jgi:hypothetical protein
MPSFGLRFIRFGLLVCFAFVCFALGCFAFVCFALLCFALLCFGLGCYTFMGVADSNPSNNQWPYGITLFLFFMFVFFFNLGPTLLLLSPSFSFFYFFLFFFISFLKTIRLHDNNIGGSLNLLMGNLTELTVLACHNNRIGGPIPESMTNCKKLEEVCVFTYILLLLPVHLAVCYWLSLAACFTLYAVW